jgi:DNA polymerase-3 subunit epsilon
VDNSGRTKHGALLDSELLAEVYLELVGGRQPGLTLGQAAASPRGGAAGPWVPPPRPRALPPRITEAERAAHDRFVEELGAAALWPQA